jgi:hypothetical protein
MSVPGAAVVVDHTALLALGAGSQFMSRIVTAAHHRTDRFVLAPALCLAAAVAARPALADHLGGLPAIRVLDLGFSDASGVGQLLADGADWRHAHAVVSARPSPEWPDGLPVVTAEANAYAHHRVITIPVP